MNRDGLPTLTLRAVGKFGPEVVALIAGYEINGFRPWFKVTMRASLAEQCGMPWEFPIFGEALARASTLLLGASE